MFWKRNLHKPSFSLTRIEALIRDFDEVSILLLIAQLVIRWIVENALRDRAVAFSITFHDVWMVSGFRACRILRWWVNVKLRWTGRIVIIHFWTESDNSWMYIDSTFTVTTANYEVCIVSRRTTPIHLISTYSCTKTWTYALTFYVHDIPVNM